MRKCQPRSHPESEKKTLAYGRVKKDHTDHWYCQKPAIQTLEKEIGVTMISRKRKKNQEIYQFNRKLEEPGELALCEANSQLV